MAWEVADWYRKAILLTKEHDIENEAIAYSRLGRLYEKVFKINYRAKENYKRSLQLAQSLYPMTFTEFGKHPIILYNLMFSLCTNL